MPTFTRKVVFDSDDIYNPDKIFTTYSPNIEVVQAKIYRFFSPSAGSDFKKFSQMIGYQTLPDDAIINSIRLDGNIKFTADTYIKSGEIGINLGGVKFFSNETGENKTMSCGFILTLTPTDSNVGLSLGEVQNKSFGCDISSTGIIEFELDNVIVTYTSASAASLTLSHEGPGYTQLFYGDTCVYSFDKTYGEHTIELPYCGNLMAYCYWIKVNPEDKNKLTSIKVYRNNNGTLTYMSNFSKEETNLYYNNIANGKIEVVCDYGSNADFVLAHTVMKTAAYMKKRLVQEIRQGTKRVIGAHESNYYEGSESLVSYNNCYVSEKIFEYDYHINDEELYDKYGNIKGVPRATGGILYEYGERQPNGEYITRHVYNDYNGYTIRSLSLRHPDIIAIRNVHDIDTIGGNIAYCFSDNDNLESVEFGYLGEPSRISSLNGIPGIVSNCPKLSYLYLGKIYQGHTKTIHSLAENSYNIKEIWGLNLSGIAMYYSNPMGCMATTTEYNIPKHGLKYLSLYCDSADKLYTFLYKIRNGEESILENHNGAASGEYVIDISLCPKAVIDAIKQNENFLDPATNYGWTVVTTPSSRFCGSIKFTNGSNTTAVTSLSYFTEGEEVLDMNDILFPYVTPKNSCKEPIRWSSSDRTIGYFEDELSGVFIVKKSGAVTITAKCGTKIATCELTLDHLISNPSLSVGDNHVLSLTNSDNSICECYDVSYKENTYYPMIVDELTPYKITYQGIDHYLNTYRADLNETPSLFRVNGLIPFSGGYWNDTKTDGSEYKLIPQAFPLRYNNMNFTYGFQMHTYSETGYEKIINKAIHTVNGFLDALNISIVERSSNKLTFMEYDDTWLGATTLSGQGYFLINMNTRTLTNDYGAYTDDDSTVAHRKWLGTLTHELGHTLGLDDNATHTPTIYNYDRDRSKCLWLQPNDKVAYKELVLMEYGVDITKSQEEIDQQWIGLGGNSMLSVATYGREEDVATQLFDYYDYGENLEEHADVIVNGTLKYIETKLLNISKNRNPRAGFVVKYRIYSIEVEDIEKGELREALIKVPVNAMKDIEEGVRYKLYLKQYDNNPCSFVSDKGYVKLDDNTINNEE